MAPQHQLIRFVKDENAAVGSRVEQAHGHAPSHSFNFRMICACTYIHIGRDEGLLRGRDSSYRSRTTRVVAIFGHHSLQHSGVFVSRGPPCTANLCCSVVSLWNRCTGGQLVGSVARMPEAHPPVEKHSTPRLIAVLKEWI